MNINNPLIKLVMYGNADISRQIRNYGKIDICTLVSTLIVQTIAFLLAAGLFGAIVLIPLGHVIGEFIGAIVTGYWTWESMYGLVGLGLLMLSGLVAILVAIVFIAFAVISLKEYKGNNVFILAIKSIKEKACYQIEIKK